MSLREVAVGVEASNRHGALQFAGRLPNGHMSLDNVTSPCSGTRARFNPATTGVRLVIPARCLNGSPKVRVSVTSIDERYVATRHRFRDTAYIDSAKRRNVHLRGLLSASRHGCLEAECHLALTELSGDRCTALCFGSRGPIVATFVVELAAPTYTGSYRHHDPAGDMRVNISSCPDNGTVSECASSAVTQDSGHRNSDIVGVHATYRGDRLYVSVRMRAWPRGMVTGHSNRKGMLTIGTDKVPHHRRVAEMDVSQDMTAVDGASWDRGGHLCRGLRTHLDRATVTLHISMRRECFGRARKLAISPLGWDSSSKDDGTTTDATIWHDFGLRTSDPAGPAYSPWIHHN